MQNAPALRAVDDDFIPDVRKAEEPRPAVVWGPVKKLLFRFAFVYLLLYSFPFPIDYLPFQFIGTAYGWYFQGMTKLVHWTGEQVFGVTITVQPNGSGDTTYNYVQVFCYLVVSVAAALVWSLLDRKRANYARLYDWLRVYTRFVLAATMISYGAYKVIPSQFPAPTMDRLMQPYGDASPMGLLWTFMGASVAYNIFSGLGEMVGGLLLTLRRTTLLGALVCIGVMSNIVMLNFSYDVPVKLYSCHLLLMAFFLAAHDLRRLANVLVLNRPVEPAEVRPYFRRKWLNRTAIALAAVFTVYATGFTLKTSWDGVRTYGDKAPKPPLYGMWEVEELMDNGKVRPPLVTDRTRWRRLFFTGGGRASIQYMSDSRERYNIEIDPKKRTIAMTKREDPDWKTTFSYRQPQPGILMVQGPVDGHKIRARLRKAEPPKALLVTRGFHWINERPFNR